jgi:hypothetical protein
MINMQPSRDGALIDLIDSILVKGVILQADVIISVSGVPLIGVNLKAAIAGLTTMVDYGMMGTWDEQIRRSVLAESKEEAPLLVNEEIVLKTFGSYYSQDNANSGVWRSGYLYLTNKRLFLFKKNPAEFLFVTDLHEIKGLSLYANYKSNRNKVLRVLIKKTCQFTDEIALLCANEIDELKIKLDEKIMLETEKVLVSVN